MLNGREYGIELTGVEEQQAKELGFIIIFGASDDLVEFRGAIDEEVDCDNGRTVYLNKNGIFEECEDNCIHSQKAKEKTIRLRTLFDAGNGYIWEYKFEDKNIKYETFDILEDGEKYCKGIIFNINELKSEVIR